MSGNKKAMPNNDSCPPLKTDAATSSWQHTAAQLEGNVPLYLQNTEMESEGRGEIDFCTTNFNAPDDDDAKTAFTFSDSDSSWHRLREAFSTWCEIMTMTATIGKYVVRSQQYAGTGAGLELNSEAHEDVHSSNKRRRQLYQESSPPKSFSSSEDSKLDGDAAATRATNSALLSPSSVTGKNEKSMSMSSSGDGATTSGSTSHSEIEHEDVNTGISDEGFTRKRSHEQASGKKTSTTDSFTTKTSPRRETSTTDSDNANDGSRFRLPSNINNNEHSSRCETMMRAFLHLQAFQIQFAGLIRDQEILECSVFRDEDSTLDPHNTDQSS